MSRRNSRARQNRRIRGLSFTKRPKSRERSAQRWSGAPPSGRKRIRRTEMEGNMTKTDLVEGLSNKLGLVKIDAERVVDCVLDAITAALKQGDRVNISGFGTFGVSMRDARTGRNPQTGES